MTYWPIYVRILGVTAALLLCIIVMLSVLGCIGYSLWMLFTTQCCNL